MSRSPLFFEKTADNEKEHAKMWFKELSGIGDTADNLLAAAEGENDEWTDMYDEMAETAEEEGFTRAGAPCSTPGRRDREGSTRSATCALLAQRGDRRGL